MAVYHKKLIELLEVDKSQEKSFLRVRLSFEQDVELLWEVDNDTVNNIRKETEFGKSFKFRLSFHSSWDPIKNQYVSFLTRTYRDKSDRIYFSCSEDYVKALNTIKHRKEINNIDTLSFFSFNLSDVNMPDSEQEHKQTGIVPKQYYRKFTWAAVALVSVISTILFGYSVLASKTPSDDNTPSKRSVALINKSNTTLKEKMYIPVNHSTEEIKTSDSAQIPFIELDDELTYSIPEGSVALTFDDGPSKYSKEIVDVLKKYQVGGTFFFIGLNVKKYPNYVRYVNSNGYAIGTHSMNHVHISGLPYMKQESELIQPAHLIEKITNEKVDLFRPPYGDMNQQTVELMSEHQSKMVLWNNDPKDWKTQNTNDIFNHIRSSKTSGSIILLHESQVIIDALPQIIEYLQGQGLQIVSLK